MKSSTVDEAAFACRGAAREFAPAVALFLAGMAALVVATLSPSGKDDQYAVVAPPWYRAGEAMALVKAADGDIVDLGGAANVIIAHSTSPDFVGALYAAGAWLVIDPISLRGCSVFGLGQERDPDNV